MYLLGDIFSLKLLIWESKKKVRPLSFEGEKFSRLGLSTQPDHCKPTILPSQRIVFGCGYAKVDADVECHARGHSAGDQPVRCTDQREPDFYPSHPPLPSLLVWYFFSPSLLSELSRPSNCLPASFTHHQTCTDVFMLSNGLLSMLSTNCSYQSCC